MDLSNLNPAVEKKKSIEDAREDLEEAVTQEKEEIQPLVKAEELQTAGGNLSGRVITDEKEIAAIEAKKKQTNTIVDAATRVAAQMRLEACENDVTIEAVYNERVATLMSDESLDENGFKLAKMVLDGAFKVAKEMGVPDKEDAATILLLAKTATGEFNPREELQGARVIATKKSKLSDKEKSKRRKKSKQAKKSRKVNRK